eukprot:18487-Heterococcus_DN1.PRE.5
MVQVLSVLTCKGLLTSESNAAKSPDVNLWKFFLKLYASTHSEFVLLQALADNRKTNRQVLDRVSTLSLLPQSKIIM